jgi:FtsH-binding integral membrane protein
MRSTQNTQMQCVDRTWNFLSLNLVVRTVATVLLSVLKPLNNIINLNYI